MNQPEASARLQAASQVIEDALPPNRANKHGVYTLIDASQGMTTGARIFAIH